MAMLYLAQHTIFGGLDASKVSNYFTVQNLVQASAQYFSGLLFKTSAHQFLFLLLTFVKFEP